MKVRCAVADLSPGMIVAEDLVGREGGRLLAEGAVLDAGSIAVLHGSGITTVMVRHAAAASERGRSGTTEVDLRFRHGRGRPAVEALREAVIRYWTDRGSDNA